MHIQPTREVTLLTQERDEILAERNLYRKQLSDALSDLKLRHSEFLDLKQHYNDVCSELADVKRDLARLRLQLSAGTVYSQGKGVLGDSAESITTQNTDISLDLTAVSTSSTEDGTAVDGGGGRSFSESQITARTTSRTDATPPEIVEPRPKNMQHPRVCTPLPAELPRAHTPLPVVDDIDEGQVPPPPMSETPTNLVPFPMPTSDPVPTPDHILPFAESGSMLSSVGMQTKKLILDNECGGFVSDGPLREVYRYSAKLIQLANKSQCETDAQTLKDVVNVIYEMAVNAPGQCKLGIICTDMTEHINPNIWDSETRDGEGNPLKGGRLFKKLLLHRCKVDFERWVSFASRNPLVSEEIVSASVDWDEEDAGQESDHSAEMLILLGLLGSLSGNMLPERVIVECMERLVTLLEAGASARACIEGLDKILSSAGQKLLNTSLNTRGRMDVCFERLKELASPRKLRTIDIGIDMRGMLRALIDSHRQNFPSLKRTAVSPGCSEKHI